MGLSRASRNIANKAAKRMGEIAANPKATIEGKIADFRRGSLLWKQGYGKTYDRPLKVAKKGKSQKKAHRADLKWR